MTSELELYIKKLIYPSRKFPKGYTAVMYRQYLQTDKWREKRTACLKARRGRCEICDGRDNLTVHHLTYRDIGNESIEQLALLCWNCHDTSHRLGGVKRVKPSSATLRIIAYRRFGITSKKISKSIRNFEKRRGLNSELLETRK